VSVVSKLKKRFVPIILIGTVSLLLGGCVYLRLLELKKQLSHFDENFSVPPTEDLTLQCRHPLLQPSDLRWLGAVPKTITAREGGEDWLVRWVKEAASGINEEFVYDMVLHLRFVDGRMVEVQIPKRHLAYVSKDLLVNMLRSTGAAKVDRDDHAADAQTETSAAVPPPNLSTIKAMLGDPTSKQTTAGRIIQLYRYRLDIANTTAKPIEATFVFDAASGELRKFTARLPRGTLNYDFKPAAPSQSKEPARDSTQQPPAKASS
jgi:hypothetical protein